MVERPAEVEESFSQAAPLVYHYGHTNMNNNSTLYNTLVSRMAEVIHQRMDDNPRSNLHLLILILCQCSQLFLSFRPHFKSQNILMVYNSIYYYIF